jgi:hypothetical protein
MKDFGLANSAHAEIILMTAADKEEGTSLRKMVNREAKVYLLNLQYHFAKQRENKQSILQDRTALLQTKID